MLRRFFHSELAIGLPCDLYPCGESPKPPPVEPFAALPRRDQPPPDSAAHAAPVCAIHCRKPAARSRRDERRLRSWPPGQSRLLVRRVYELQLQPIRPIREPLFSKPAVQPHRRCQPRPETTPQSPEAVGNSLLVPNPEASSPPMPCKAPSPAKTRSMWPRLPAARCRAIPRLRLRAQSSAPTLHRRWQIP